MERVIAALVCHGCEELIRVPIGDLRVERHQVHFICDICGRMSRKFDRDVMAEMTDWDVPGGTRVSEREVDQFARESRRIERHWDELLESF
jgi:RNase P subunit RPR2